MSALTRNKAGGYTARKSIPKDVRADYQRLFGPGWEAKLTLPADLPLPEAKAKFSEWLAEIETRIATIRARQRGEAQGLTRTQARALAGEWYQWFLARNEERPGGPEHWALVFDVLVDELRDLDPEGMWAQGQNVDLERVLRDNLTGIRPFIADHAHAGQFLASRGVVLTNDARDLFLDHVASDYLAAIGLLQQRAEGDYSPDDRPRQFPQFTRPGKAMKGQGLSSWSLFEQWVTERKPALSTVNRWRAVFLTLQAHFKDKSADEITEDEAREWARSLVTAKRSADTASAIWLSAIRRIFSWAAEQKLIRSNPFKQVKITIPRKVQTREKAFTEQEAKTILGAAVTIKASKNTFKCAQRWVPWICAYSGARAGEIAQLRGVDVDQQGNFYTMKLTPEAGTIKTRKARTVPMHEHVIAQGFLDFVKARGNGPLFYTPEDKTPTESSPTNPRRARAVMTRQRLAAWVRKLGITDPEVSPNHSWRHTFKQIADRHGISERVSDAITGHAPATVGRTYGAPNDEDMARELKKFPRYNT